MQNTCDCTGEMLQMVHLQILRGWEGFGSHYGTTWKNLRRNGSPKKKGSVNRKNTDTCISMEIIVSAHDV